MSQGSAITSEELQQLRMYEQAAQNGLQTGEETITQDTEERFASFLRQRAVGDYIYDSLETVPPPCQKDYNVEVEPSHPYAIGTCQTSAQGSSVSNSTTSMQSDCENHTRTPVGKQVRETDAENHPGRSKGDVWRMVKPELDLEHSQVRQSTAPHFRFG